MHGSFGTAGIRIPAPLPFLHPAGLSEQKADVIGVSQSFGSLKIQGWSLWGITVHVLSEFRYLLSVCALGGGGGNKKVAQVIPEINTSVSPGFSLSLKRRHWPFVHPTPRVCTHLFIMCFINF